MADSASVISSKNSEKSKLSNLINRTTSETLRLNDIEKAVNSPNSLSTNAPRKKTSFQITSVIVGSRASNDGGDDSADDLDESHAEDISEVLDNSRITDLENETPSYSEDTFSKDDVFFNASSSLVSAPVIPTSSQYGLAIVATPEHSESALNQSGNCENSDTVDVSSVDVTENVINLGVVSTKHDPEMRDMHPPAPRTERFKVVKIESTEPFKRGRWVCMDYLDHNIAQKDQPSSKADSGDNTTAVTTEVNSTAPAEQAVVNSAVEEQPQAPVPTEVVNTPASNMQANENSQVSSNQIPISSAPTAVPTSYPSVSPGQSLQSSMQMGHIINSTNATPVASQQSQSLSQVHMQQILANSNQHQSLQPQQMQQVMASANVMPIQQQNPIPQAMQQQPVMQQPLQQMQQMHQPAQQYQSQPQNISQQSVPQQQTMPQQQQTLTQQPQSMTQQQPMPAQQPSLPQQQQTIPQQQQQPQQTMPQQQQQQQQPMPQPQQVLQPQQSLPQQQQTMPQQQQQTIPQQQQSIPQQQQGIPQQQQQGIPQQQQGIPQQQQGIPQQQQMPQQQGMPQQQQPMQQQQYQPMQQQQQQPMMQQQMPQQPMQNQMPVQQVQMQPGVQQMTMQQPQSQPPMQQQQMLQQPMQQMQQQQPTQMHQVSYSQPTIPNQTSQQQVPGMMPQMHPQQMTGFQQGQMMANIQPQPIMNIQSQPHLQPQYYPVSQPMQSGIVTSQTGLMTQGTMPQVSMQGSTPNLPPLQTYASVASMPPMQVTNMPQTPPIPTSVQYNMQHMPQTSQPMTLPPMSMPQTIIPPQPQPSQQQPPQQPPQPAQSYAGISSPAQSYTHGMSSSSVPSALMMEHPLMNGEHSDNPTASLIESLNEVTSGADEIQPGEDAESTSGANAVAIDNKIEQAMDLVKSHLMYAVREEVEVLKEKIAELMDRIGQLEAENATLRAGASPETLALLPPVNQNSATNNP